MESGRPSTTASWIALDRALGSLQVDPIARDPFAEQLLPPKFARLVARAKERPQLFSAFSGFLNRITTGRARHIQLRTRVIDDAVETRAKAGDTQLVLLGAGLDARAYRLNHLESTTVFEVDHPATQAYKRGKIADLSSRAKRVVYVPVDFEHDDLAARLVEAGHDASLPTTFVWEGVVMYLTADSIESTLTTLSRSAAPGSTLLMTYWMPTQAHSLYMMTVNAVLRSVSEPLKSAFVPSEVEAKFAAHGFVVEEDLNDIEMAARYRPSTPQALSPERVVRATKR